MSPEIKWRLKGVGLMVGIGLGVALYFAADYYFTMRFGMVGLAFPIGVVLILIGWFFPPSWWKPK